MISARVVLAFALGSVLAIPLVPSRNWTYPNKDTKRYCAFVIPPYQINSVPKLELVYCAWGSSKGTCVLDLQPGWIAKGLGDNIMECE